MRVLVTGGAGYLGTTLIRRLLRRGHSVCCLDPRAGDIKSLLDDVGELGTPRYLGVPGDVRDRAALDATLKYIDGVVHLAAVVGYPMCDKDPDAASSINVGGTECLVAAVPKGIPLVLSSTCSVYGRVDTMLCCEAGPVNPLTHYGRTKADSENIVLSAAGTVLRFATIYGLSPRFRWDLLMHSLFRAALNKERLLLYEPDAWRPLIHVEDAAEAICFALENFAAMSGGVFNAGSSASTLTKLELARRIAGLVEFHVEVDEGRSDPDQRNYRVSFERLEALGYAVKYGIDEGMAETFNGARRLFDQERVQ
jgi:nucleoside-diphosphate-sugar epimerase